MGRRFVCALITLLLALSLSACTISPAPGPSDPGSDPEPAPAANMETVAEVKCFTTEEYVSGVFDAGDCVLFRTEDSRNMMDGPSETDRSHLYLIDLVKDEIIHTGELQTTWEQIAGIRENGDVATIYEKTIRIYRKDLTFERSFELDSEVYSAEVVPEKDLIYCKATDGGVCAYTFDGERRQVYVRDDVDFYSSDIQGDHWIGVRSSADDLYDSETFVCSEGSLAYVARMGWTSSSYCFTGRKMISERAVQTEDGEDISYIADVYDTDTWKQTGSFRTELYMDLHGGADEPYTVGIYNGVSEDDPLIKLTFCDWEKGKWAEKIVPTKGAYSVWCVYHKKTKRFVVAFGGEETSWAYSVDPAGIMYPNGFEEYEDPAPAEKHALGAEYAGLRERADKLERKYPVRILLGDEVLNPLNTSGYTLVSFEEPDESYLIEEDIERVGYVLDNIEEALASFADGFLDRFRDDLGEGGLRFLIVRRLENESMGSFTAGGVQYKTGSWYNVALDMGLHGEDFGLGTVHHEVFHAVEHRISDEKLTAFDETRWMELNPEGFEYLNDFENYGNQEEYTIEGGQDVYFVIPYGKVNSLEDRATIIEYVFEWRWGQGNGYDEICKYPHLKAKLDEMARATREVFGSVYWEPVSSENAAA